MPKQKQSLAWDCVLAESERRVAAIEAESARIKREVDALVAAERRAKWARLLKFWKSN
jgi:hypothetical protein